MRAPNVGSAILADAVSPVAMTVLTHAAPLMGPPVVYGRREPS